MHSELIPLSSLFNFEIDNEIVEVSGFDPNKLGRLKVLELRGNKLMTTVGLFNLPNLKELYMVRNSKQINYHKNVYGQAGLLG